MNTPIKAAEATVPAQNVEKTTGNTENKTAAPEEKKVEVTNPAPVPVK